VHVPRRHHISAPAQKRRYDLHRNDPADAGYCAFLGRLMEPLAARLAPGAQGLDFGCGPAPVLATLLSQRGFRMTHYDPFYAAHPAALTRAYDFVACSETVEHFTRPRDDWQRLFRLVRPGGWLGVMTSLLTPETDFARWRYRMDETHVCFYRSETLTWLETHHGARLHPAGPSVFLFEC
jgi:2-polyprenyl-3-methyl-5-hydroxy-6-metoxy-1,4-benzoquinol methylase